MDIESLQFDLLFFLLNNKGTEVRIWGFSTWMARVVSEASHGACFDTRSAQSTSNMPTCDGNLLDWFCRVLGARLRSTFRRGSLVQVVFVALALLDTERTCFLQQHAVLGSDQP